MTSSDAGIRTNTLALIGFIAAFVMPVLGLVLGIVAVNQLRSAGNVQSGGGFARWAIVIGALGTAAQGIFFVFWVILATRAIIPG